MGVKIPLPTEEGPEAAGTANTCTPRLNPVASSSF